MVREGGFTSNESVKEKKGAPPREGEGKIVAEKKPTQPF